ncbi:MAG: hypothetical protein SWK76_11305 [Actinomycetota bacterium]|nr:hypothetical protein [Actinomycetota bacterium]
MKSTPVSIDPRAMVLEEQRESGMPRPTTPMVESISLVRGTAPSNAYMTSGGKLKGTRIILWPSSLARTA